MAVWLNKLLLVGGTYIYRANSIVEVITDHIDDNYRILAEAAGAFVEVGLIQLEGGHVGCKYRRIDHQYENQPIPSGLKYQFMHML